jgi:histone acetyltransferase HTATIP/histone acetyltransferase MYST1
MRCPRVLPSAHRYFSPYPLTDGDGEDVIGHGRTMDLFAGAVNRENASDVLWVCDRCFKYMTDGTSWEVHMVRFGSPLSWAMEGMHVNRADGHRGSAHASIHQVGRYTNGVHIRFGRWMARRKRCARFVRSGRQFSSLTPRGQLYCQNLSLFGKLFIDIKTLFFDCDNCERSRFP